MVVLGSGGVTDEKDLEGFTVVKRGRYHAMITDADESFEKLDNSVIVSFGILAGTEADEAGKTHREFLGVGENVVKRLKKLAYVLGLINKEQLGLEIDVDFQQGVGRDLVIDIEDHSYTKEGEDGTTKTVVTTRITFLGFHAIGSPGAAGVPLAEDLGISGGGIGPSGPSQSSGEAGQSAPSQSSESSPAATAAPAAPKDNWDDLVT